MLVQDINTGRATYSLTMVQLWSLSWYVLVCWYVRFALPVPRYRSIIATTSAVKRVVRSSKRISRATEHVLVRQTLKSENE